MSLGSAVGGHDPPGSADQNTPVGLALVSADATVDVMGDDACWLDRTCLSCGRFVDLDEAQDRRCPHCGADLPAPADDEAV